MPPISGMLTYVCRYREGVVVKMILTSQERRNNGVPWEGSGSGLPFLLISFHMDLVTDSGEMRVRGNSVDER